MVRMVRKEYFEEEKKNTSFTDSLQVKNHFEKRQTCENQKQKSDTKEKQNKKKEFRPNHNVLLVNTDTERK